MAAPPALPLITPTPAALPKRKIFSEPDMAAWVSSETYHYVQVLIARLALAVEGKKITDACQENEATKALVAFLQELERSVDDIPLQTTPQRFGNKAFKDWVELMTTVSSLEYVSARANCQLTVASSHEQKSSSFQPTLLPPPLRSALPELSHHFSTAFGSPVRIDYGTGHELSFVTYLLILRLVGVFTEAEEQALVTRVFVAYLGVVRKCQKVFKLEPAGSKGVWGLDDHQFLSYLWGASQLKQHPTLRPSLLLTIPTTADSSAQLLHSSLSHLHALKSGPFAEHSPMLHSISSTVPNFTKMETGLMRMYRDEVLGKLVVVQHLWFADGGVLGWRKEVTGEDLPSTGDQMEREAEEEEKEEAMEGTKAPWALPELNISDPPPLTKVQLPKSTITSVNTSRPFSRQVPTPTSFASTTAPKPFLPPELFATSSTPRPRPTPSTAPVGRTMVPQQTSLGDRLAARATTVADEGGAAAGSSPFGVLESATRSVGKGREGLPWREEDR
ncbi:protein phosphatase 2 (formerly 2A), regulatory subunit B' [Pseudohyphozyma bogoriensis]|nr:protein phosphatase 2 (formerly 2A), regulatory subunit B' [Pseudohyphozyma bogoriensis]